MVERNNPSADDAADEQEQQLIADPVSRESRGEELSTDPEDLQDIVAGEPAPIQMDTSETNRVEPVDGDFDRSIYDVEGVEERRPAEEGSAAPESSPRDLGPPRLGDVEPPAVGVPIPYPMAAEPAARSFDPVFDAADTEIEVPQRDMNREAESGDGDASDPSLRRQDDASERLPSTDIPPRTSGEDDAISVEAYPVEAAAMKPEEQPEEEENPPAGYQNVDTMLAAEDARVQADDGAGSPRIDPSLLEVSRYPDLEARADVSQFVAEDDSDATQYELIANEPVLPDEDDEDDGEERLVGDDRGDEIDAAAERLLPDFDAGRVADLPAGRQLDVFDINTDTSNIPGGDSAVADIEGRDHGSMLELGSSDQGDDLNPGASVADGGWRLGETTVNPDGSQYTPIYDSDPVSATGSDGVIVETVIGETTWGPSPDNPNVWEGATVVNGETVTMTTRVTESDGTEVTLHTYTDEQGNSVARTTTVAPDGSRTETWERTDAEGNVTTETKHYDKDGNETTASDDSNDGSDDSSDDSSDSDSSDDSGDDGSDSESDDSSSDDTSTAGTDTDGEETETESSVDPFGPQPLTPEQFEQARAYAEWKMGVQAGSDVTPAPDDGEGDAGEADGGNTPGVKDPDEDQIFQDLEGVTLEPGIRDQGNIDFGPDHSYGPGPQQSDPSAYADQNQQDFQEANQGPQDAQIDDAIDFTPSYETGRDATEQVEEVRSGGNLQHTFELLTSNGDSDESEESESLRLQYQFDGERATLLDDSESSDDDDDDLDGLD